jgi:hypothetical protein
MKLNGTHHLLVYADDVNLLGDTDRYHKYKCNKLIAACKEVGLEVNERKLSVCCRAKSTAYSILVGMPDGKRQL